MKKSILLLFIAVISFMASSQTVIYLSVDGNTMSATLADNEATRELLELLKEGTVTIRMNDYGGFEKVGELPVSLTTSNAQITTVPGDIMLYQGNHIVIFYGSNSWSYTRLGKIDGVDVSEIKRFLGSGSISLTLSLNPDSGIKEVSAYRNAEDVVYDLNGNRKTLKILSPGVYIINGKKTLLRNN